MQQMIQDISLGGENHLMKIGVLIAPHKSETPALYLEIVVHLMGRMESIRSKEVAVQILHRIFLCFCRYRFERKLSPFLPDKRTISVNTPDLP